MCNTCVYPERRLTVHCYKKFIFGPPADGSQRVKRTLFSAMRVTSVKNNSRLALLEYRSFHEIKDREKCFQLTNENVLMYSVYSSKMHWLHKCILASSA